MGQEELKPEDIDTTITPFYGALKRTWPFFCSRTSIHGLRHVVDPDIHRYIRFIWLLVTVTMFLCAVVMAHSFYMEYRSNPTQVNIDTDYAPVESLYFPAITLCPEVLFNVERSQDYVSTLKLPPGINTTDVMDGLRFANGFIHKKLDFKVNDVHFMQDVLELNNLTVFNLAEALRWDCKDFLFRCRWRWRFQDCNELFQVSRTLLGHCCSFNLNQTGLVFTDQHARPGLRDALSIIIHYGDQYELLGPETKKTFNLLLTETNAYPSLYKLAKFIPLNQELFVDLQVTELYCSQPVLDLTVDQRQCVQPHEFPLKYFPTYMHHHCELNCRLKQMVKYCGCITYMFWSNRTKDRVCGFKDIPCLNRNFATIMAHYQKSKCICPEQCERFGYDLTLSNIDLDLDKPVLNHFYEGVARDYSALHIYVNSQVYSRLRRDLQMNMIKLVSNLGGAFSLFVGMSMVSVVEIIYHFTVILRQFYLQEVKARDQILFRRPKTSISTIQDKRKYI